MSLNNWVIRTPREARAGASRKIRPKPKTTFEWATPPEFFDNIDREFHFDLDAAASDINHKCPEYYTKHNSGLGHSWEGKRVWINPPFKGTFGIVDLSDVLVGALRVWLEKVIKERSKTQVIVLLVPAKTDTRWFHQHVLPHVNEIRFIKGRMKFVYQGQGVDAGQSNTVCMFGLMLLVFWPQKEPLKISAIDSLGAALDNPAVKPSKLVHGNPR